jgi:hypothetical protein
MGWLTLGWRVAASMALMRSSNGKLMDFLMVAAAGHGLRRDWAEGGILFLFS